jgi:FkbM family methyltransferase
MTLTNSLSGYLRGKFHPLWRLRRSAVYPWLERAFERTVMKKIDGLPHRVAMLRLRDLSWWVGGANLEPETKSFFQRLLKVRPIAVFYDVGANIGFYSWFVRTVSPHASLVLFEPDPLNASLLRQMVEANQLQGVTLIEAAVSNVEGPQPFIRDRVSGATGRLKEVDSSADPMTIQGSYAAQNQETCRVECRTLDEVVSSGVPAPDLIKVDVENAEHLVVEGGKRLFSAKTTLVLIEISDPRVFTFFAEHGYDVWVIEASAANYFAAPAGMLNDSSLMAPYRKMECESKADK